MLDRLIDTLSADIVNQQELRQNLNNLAYIVITVGIFAAVMLLLLIILSALLLMRIKKCEEEIEVLKSTSAKSITGTSPSGIDRQ